MKHWIYLLCILPLTLKTNGQSYVNYTNLADHVLEGYNPDILPLDDHTKPLIISVSAAFYSLSEVDVLKGKISFVLTLTSFWLDSQITWSPADYGNITSLSLPRNKVWTPSFVVGSAVDFTVIGDTWMPVSFSPDGLTTLTVGDVVNSGCSFNMKFWPFDKQTCDVVFALYGYDMTQIRLQLTQNNSFSMFLLNENVEWVLNDAQFYVRQDRGVSELILTLHLERRSDIFVILIIFPFYGLASLNSMVFLLPSESGERIGFSATIMLSITVFLEVISDYIPNTSKPIPLLCIMVTLGISTSIFCIVAVIISLQFYHKDDKIPVNGCLQTMVKLCNKDFRNAKVALDNTINIESKEDYFLQSNDESKPKDHENTQDIAEENSEKDGHPRKICWMDVSYTLDKVCFIGGTVSTVLVTVGFTIYLTNGNE